MKERQIEALSEEIETRAEEIKDLRKQRGVYGEKKAERDRTLDRLQAEIRTRELERQRLAEEIGVKPRALDIGNDTKPGKLDPAVESILKRHLPQ